MEQGDDFTYNFTVETNDFSQELYESLRVWPQTRIAYAITDVGIKVVGIELTQLFKPQNPPPCDEFLCSIPVKWEYKTENENG